MRQPLEKLQRARTLGATVWGMLTFKAIRSVQKILPWKRWTESVEFLDYLADRHGKMDRSGGRLRVEASTPCLGGKSVAELRPGTSDIVAWTQIVHREEYAPVVRLLEGQSVRTIVDAGANVGLTSCYLARAFPDSRILAIEIDRDNFNLLARNLGPLGGRAICRHAAFWPQEEALEADPEPFRDGRQWAFRVRRKDSTHAGGGLPIITPKTADELLGGDGIDLLKMDIEGGEAEFFNNPDRTGDLLRRTRAIAVEVHDEIIGSEVVLRALDAAGFRVFPSGELLVGVRRQ